MWADSQRFAPWKDRRWSDWREREQAATNALFRFCDSCGFVHRHGNHAPSCIEKDTQ